MVSTTAKAKLPAEVDHPNIPQTCSIHSYPDRKWALSSLSKWLLIFIEGRSNLSIGPNLTPEFLFMCKSKRYRLWKEEDEGLKAWPEVKMANQATRSVIPSSLLHSLLFSLQNLVCVVYKFLLIGVYKFLFHFLHNINLVTVVRLQKSSKHSESFYKHLLSECWW